MKALGVLLLVAGFVALVYGGMSWTYKDKVVDAGPIEITKDKTTGVAIPPLAGLALCAGGLVLLLKK